MKNVTNNSIVKHPASIRSFVAACLFVAMLPAAIPAAAQVKIGASPATIDANSLLELEQNTSTGKYGLRLPRVALTATNNPAPLSAHVVGMKVYNTATAGSGVNVVTPGEYINDGSQWVKIATAGNGSMPAGVIVAYGASGSVAPSGWLICDGSNVSRTTYAELFAIIGTTYGIGDGSSTFTLPNGKGVFLRGSGSQTIGGSTYTSVTQGIPQNDATKVPSIPFTTDSQGNHSHGYAGYAYQNTVAGQGPYGGFSNAWGGMTTSTAGAHTHSVIGGGDSETRPANIVVTYIIKY